eukprot:scaffold12.g8277.t1
MGLFDSLPPPSKRAAEEDTAAVEKKRKLDEEFAQAVAATADPADVTEAQHAEAGGGEAAAAAAAAPEAGGEPGPDAPPPPPPLEAVGGPKDQVAAALRKIVGHIGQPKKFVKASGLLRELMSQARPPPRRRVGALRPFHGPMLFSALKAAMRDPAQAADPLLAREYSRLFQAAAAKAAGLFVLAEREQLDVYGVWTVLRGQLGTDDSFQFNKVVARLKEMVAELPEATEADDEVLQALAARAGEPDPVLSDNPPTEAAAAAPEPEAEAPPPPPPPEAEAPPPPPPPPPEADPFGLDALVAQELQAPPPPPPPPLVAPVGPPRLVSVTWSEAEVLSMRRAALLDCLDAARAAYKQVACAALWFTPAQRPRIQAHMGFVREQRRVRKLGPSAKEVNRDTTSFERARDEWSRASWISTRGKPAMDLRKPDKEFLPCSDPNGAIVGAGVLALPNTVAWLGWVAGPILLVAFYIVSLISSRMLADVYCVDNTEFARYHHAVRYILGRWNAFLLSAAQLTNLFLITGIPQGDCWSTTWKLTLLFGAAECVLSQCTLPAGVDVVWSTRAARGWRAAALQVKNLEEAWWVSSIGVATSLTYSTIALVLGCVYSGAHAFGILNALGGIAFAYSFSLILLEIQDTLRQPPSTAKTMKKAVNIGISASFVFYFTVAVVGYCALGNEVPGMVLAGFPDAPNWLIMLPMFDTIESWIKALLLRRQGGPPQGAAVKAGPSDGDARQSVTLAMDSAHDLSRRSVRNTAPVPSLRPSMTPAGSGGKGPAGLARVSQALSHSSLGERQFSAQYHVDTGFANETVPLNDEHYYAPLPVRLVIRTLYVIAASREGGWCWPTGARGERGACRQLRITVLAVVLPFFGAIVGQGGGNRGSWPVLTIGYGACSPTPAGDGSFSRRSPCSHAAHCTPHPHWDVTRRLVGALTFYPLAVHFPYLMYNKVYRPRGLTKVYMWFTGVLMLLVCSAATVAAMRGIIVSWSNYKIFGD